MSSSGLYGMFGPTLSGYLADKVGLDLPWWVWSLGAWLLVAALGVLRVDLNGRVLGVLLSAEILVLVVLSVAGLGDPASGLPLTSLSPGGLFGWDPMVRLFFWGGTTGAFGVLCLLVATSLAVLAFFARAPRDENAWHRLIAPALAAVALLAMVWTGLANYATLLGVPPGSTESWAFPAAFGVAAVAGILYGLWLRSARPTVYQGIGLGAGTRE